MANNDSAGISAAELKLKHSQNSEHSHRPTVEEVQDEDLLIHRAGEEAALARPSWGEPASAKAAGKEKVQGPERAGRTLDTQSHELFPELGGPKPKPSAGVAPVWSAKNNANGSTNGASPASGTSQVSTPVSGVSTPAGSGPHGPPALSIPGRNIETIYLEPQHILPRGQLKRPLQDTIRDLNRRSRANISMTTMGNGKLKFEAAGPQDIAQQALKDLVHQVGTKQSVNVAIPQSARAHIIGKGGATIKALQERTGAKIQLPKLDENQAQVDDDDDATINVVVEGNALSAATARDAILRIAGEKAANLNTKVKGVPAEFFPFLAGPHNSLAQGLESNGCQVRIPPHQAWWSQPPPSAPAPGQRPTFVPAANDDYIQLAGERTAVQATRAEIERRVEELRRQLVLEQLSIQRGRHQFIIGERGIPVNEFFHDTGCAIILPTADDDDMVTVIGPPDRIQAGLERAMDLATTMQCSNIDISRFHRQAPGGAAAHARNVTRYLRQRKEIERLERLYNVHFNTPFTEEGALPWELYSRDGKNAIRAHSEIKGIVDSHPPSRMATVAVDPFFHQYLRSEIKPQVNRDYGVHLVVPESHDSVSPVLLVYEGPATPDTPYQVPSTQPTPANIRQFEQGLRSAQSHIVSLINQQEALTSASIDVPHKFHDKLRKFIKKEQENRPAHQIPARVSSLGTTVTIRGPSSAVNALAARCEAFLEQERADEKERGFTMEFDFSKDYAQHIIGKGGSRIRELRDKFDVDIQVHDGKVELKGPKAKAEAAKAHIQTLGRQLADEVTHTLKVDPKFHKELIGAQGQQINKLQTRYKVLIFFPRSAKNAKEDESVADATSEAGKPRRQQAPDEVIVRGPKKGADSAREEILDLVKYMKENSYTASVLVQQRQLPSLIGQGGSAMEHLRQATGAKIDIPNGRDSAEDHQVEIQIKGTQSQVNAAKKVLEEKKAIFDDTVVRTLEVDRQYHKAIIGQSGTNLNRLISKAGGSSDRRELSVQFPKQDTDGNMIKVQGRTQVVDNIVAQIKEFVAQRESEVTETIEVPVEKHRSLVGRGGNVKQGLESQFNVAIAIPKQGSGETEVRITGQSADVEKAKAHILATIKEQEGETIQIPRSMHHAVSGGGQLFRKLRSEHGVAVDHAGQTLPPKPTPSSTRGSGGVLPLITDDADAVADAHHWSVVEHVSTEEGDIPWVLRGSPENIEKAKSMIESALEQAKKLNATGYLILPDPRTYRHVIGQGGSKVNSIRKQSGCRITVPRNQEKDEAIEIVGSKDGVEKAKELILAAVKDGVNGSGAR